LLRRSLDSAKVGDTEKLDGFKRLDGFVRAIESQCEPRASFDAALAHERKISRSIGGRTVFDDRRGRKRQVPPAQLNLFG
jgi:hypothetical protein